MYCLFIIIHTYYLIVSLETFGESSVGVYDLLNKLIIIIIKYNQIIIIINNYNNYIRFIL